MQCSPLPSTLHLSSSETSQRNQRHCCQVIQMEFLHRLRCCQRFCRQQVLQSIHWNIVIHFEDLAEILQIFSKLFVLEIVLQQPCLVSFVYLFKFASKHGIRSVQVPIHCWSQKVANET